MSFIFLFFLNSYNPYGQTKYIADQACLGHMSPSRGTRGRGKGGLPEGLPEGPGLYITRKNHTWVFITWEIPAGDTSTHAFLSTIKRNQMWMNKKDQRHQRTSWREGTAANLCRLIARLLASYWFVLFMLNYQFGNSNTKCPYKTVPP